MPQNWPELALRIITCKQEKSTGSGTSTLPLNPMGRIDQSPKW